MITKLRLLEAIPAKNLAIDKGFWAERQKTNREQTIPTIYHQLNTTGRLDAWNLNWQPEHRKFSITAGPATEARIRTFYYPHWVARNESGLLPTRPDKDGALLITLPQNATNVELGFQEPRKTKFSTMASMMGLIAIGALSVPFRRRAKR